MFTNISGNGEVIEPDDNIAAIGSEVPMHSQLPEHLLKLQISTKQIAKVH